MVVTKRLVHLDRRTVEVRELIRREFKVGRGDYVLVGCLKVVERERIYSYHHVLGHI